MRVAVRILLPVTAVVAAFGIAYLLAGSSGETPSTGGAATIGGELSSAEAAGDAPRLAQLGNAPQLPAMETPEPKPTPTDDSDTGGGDTGADTGGGTGGFTGGDTGGSTGGDTGGSTGGDTGGNTGGGDAGGGDTGGGGVLP